MALSTGTGCDIIMIIDLHTYHLLKKFYIITL